jgi:pimeloyl-ACP methyl ester carboxylesterase
MTEVSATRTFAYPQLWLWDRDAWTKRYSPVLPVAKQIMAANQAARATTVASRHAGRTDGIYTVKTRATTFPDIVAALAARGLEYVSDEMGQVTWFALLPSDRASDPRPRDLLVILADGDYPRPTWAMDLVDTLSADIDAAAEGGHPVLVVAPDGPDDSHMWITAIQELSMRWHIDYARVLLDVAPLVAAGGGLDADPAAGEHGSFAGRPVLDITGRWQNRVSHVFENATASRYAQGIDLDRLIHSAAGQRLAEGMATEHEFNDPDDPAFRRWWLDRGVLVETHHTAGQRWLSVAPAQVSELPAGSLPVMLVLQEVTELQPFQSVAALSSHFGYSELAAQGELMAIFFALETPEDNDLLADITRQAATIYPIDLTRVYVTGHSHNGHLAMAFLRQHPELVTAGASLGNAHGMPAPEYSHEMVPITDAELEQMASIDAPVVNIAGQVESDFIAHQPGSTAWDDAIDSWRRRAYAFHLAQHDPAETSAIFAAARSDADLATRAIGVPGDRTDVQYRMGAEVYLVDHLDTCGRLRLRLIALENMPHMPAPQMPALAWDFLRRFHRDPATGEIIDSYQ